MTAKPQRQPNPLFLRVQQSLRRLDRPTRIGMVAAVIAVLVLVSLIAFITLFPIQTVNQAITAQASQQQMVIAELVARQTEDFFNSVAYQLVNLANDPEIKATANTTHAAALARLATLGQQHQGQIKSIVRLSSNGVPLYAWPDAYNQRIQANQPLPWSVNSDWMQSIMHNQSIQLRQQRLVDGSATYILIALVNHATVASEAIVIELDLNSYFEKACQALNLSPSSQLWVFDSQGTEVYKYRPQPVFQGSFSQLPSSSNITLLPNYPVDGRESVLTPVYAVSMPSSPPLEILLSHVTSEGQEPVYSTLRVLFLLGLGVIGFITLAGLAFVRFLWSENYRRRADARRRTSIRTLLTTSHVLNSSLDLSHVLEVILQELGHILPHDAASILLLNEDKTTVSVAAEAGEVTVEEGRQTIPLDTLPRVKEVILSGKSVVHNALTDPRWTLVDGRARTFAWLGVPLRVRTEAVGVLNIQSYRANRFQADDIDLAEAFADQAGVALQNARAHEFEVRAYETEMETARAIQASLLPQEAPLVPQVQIAVRAVAAQQVSGDYYQHYVLPDNKLGVAVGDVSGKGIPAALLMAVITTSMREEILRTPSPAGLLNELNNRLGERMRQTHMNSALLMTTFDPATRHLEIANAGMVQPYVYNGTSWDSLPVGGYPVGASARSNYTSKTVTLAPGSILAVVTDGIIESQNLQKTFFGFERLEELLADTPPGATADQIADSIVNAVRLHLAGQDPQDDMTVVIIRSVDL